MNATIPRARYTLSLALALFSWPAAGAVAQDSPTPAPPPPQVPVVQLAPLTDAENEAEFLNSISTQVARVSEEASGGGTPIDRANRLLTAANLILAHQLEPACSRRLLHMEAPGAASEALQGHLDLAKKLIGEARAALEAADEGSDQDADRLVGVRHRANLLDAFSQALRTYLLPAASSEPARSARRAASRLSALLEEDDPAIAAAARLWHGCLRAHEADPTPILSTLDYALARPPRSGLRQAFFARLLRIRLIAGQGGFAGAVGLLSQLEERCEEWFSKESEAEDALRATTLVAIQILIDWHDSMSPSTQVEERRWCAERIRQLRESRFSEHAPTVLRLGQTIPIMAEFKPSDLAAPDS